MIKRAAALLPLGLGLVGVVVCAVAIMATWLVAARVDRVAVRVFGAVDEALAVVQERVVQTQEQVDSLTLTTRQIEQGIEEWLQNEAREQLAERIDVARQAERLESGLDEVDHWLELAEASVQLVQQVLEIGSSLGTGIQTEPADQLLAELTALRTQLAEAGDPVETIRQRATANGEENAEGIRQIARLAVRVLATLGVMDASLERLTARLAELQSTTRHAQSTATWWIRVVTVGVVVVFGWMGAGQAALSYLGWKWFARRER